MTQTPWGIADELRARMLRPGPGMPREEVTRSQRERLFAAMVACVERKGYEVHYHEVAGGHEPLSWRGGLADGVLELALRSR